MAVALEQMFGLMTATSQATTSSGSSTDYVAIKIFAVSFIFSNIKRYLFTISYEPSSNVDSNDTDQYKTRRMIHMKIWISWISLESESKVDLKLWSSKFPTKPIESLRRSDDLV